MWLFTNNALIMTRHEVPQTFAQQFTALRHR